ncbi:hypothetical protein HN011_007634 [Eciton burchellii]|nr:hypothetical protein HN011_007634 [Eciton burchellii]
MTRNHSLDRKRASNACRPILSRWIGNCERFRVPQSATVLIVAQFFSSSARSTRFFTEEVPIDRGRRDSRQRRRPATTGCSAFTNERGASPFSRKIPWRYQQQHQEATLRRHTPKGELPARQHLQDVQ